MRDLRVDLRLGRSHAESGHAEAGTSADSGAAGAQDQERFREALKRRAPDGGQGGEASFGTAVQPPSPFDLFAVSGRMERTALPEESSRAQTTTIGMPSVARNVFSAVAERILVSADSNREVRVTIRADLLPGVEVRVVQDQGRWVVDFFVTDAGSRKLLENAGSQAARELARRLKRGVELRVADPFADPSAALCFFDHGDEQAREEES